MTRLMLNARADAVGFYERVGWQTDDWDPSELTGIGAHSIQMTKALTGR